MKHIVMCLAVIALLHCSSADARSGKKDARSMPRAEWQLADTLLYCLHWGDTVTYQSLFLSYDTLWKMVMADTQQADVVAINHLRAHPQVLQQFDPDYNPQIINNFYRTLKMGNDSGIHWDQVVSRGYKFDKMIMTRDLVGFEKIAPVRFQGFLFIKDLLTRRNYVVCVTEMQFIKGFWYGGQIMGVFPGNTADDYVKARAAEIRRIKRRLAGLPDDTVKPNIDSTDDDADDAVAADDNDRKVPREVTDRKYYEGTFDNETPVKLYVRYLKGGPKNDSSWEAIYLIGNQKQFVKLDVTKSDDGTWSFVEDPPIGYMDLELKDKVYTGSWSTTDEKRTGYDVRLAEKNATTQQLHMMDEVFEKQLWAKPEDEEKSKDDAAAPDPNRDDSKW